jgi:hypothetical protein
MITVSASELCKTALTSAVAVSQLIFKVQMKICKGDGLLVKQLNSKVLGYD